MHVSRLDASFDRATVWEQAQQERDVCDLDRNVVGAEVRRTSSVPSVLLQVLAQGTVWLGVPCRLDGFQERASR